MNLQELPLALLLGVLAGFAGIVFNRSLLGSLNFADRFSRSQWIPARSHVRLSDSRDGMMPGLAGGGGTMADKAISGDFALGLLPLLLLSRVFPHR